MSDNLFKATIVHMILSKETEKSVELLSRKFGVSAPALSIGLPKGKKKALAVYTVEGNTIRFANEKQFFNPFVVLHEMYHCVRSSSGKHRGTEKNADRFALSYIQEYRKLSEALSQQGLSRPPKVD